MDRHLAVFLLYLAGSLCFVAGTVLALLNYLRRG